jgi:soluble lytic murein transglycosylase
VSAAVFPEAPSADLSPAQSLPIIASAEEGFTFAREAFQGGDPEVSEQYAKSVINRYPDTPWRKRSLFLLGTTYLARDRTAEASEVMLSVPTEYPELADHALFALAEHFAAKKRYADAVVLYQRLIDDYSSSPLLPRVVLGKGQTLLDAGMFRDAAAAFELSLREHPRSDQAQDAALGLGKARAESGDLAGAVRAYIETSVKHPAPDRDQEIRKALNDLASRGAVVPRLTADELYERARNLFRANRFEEAYRDFGNALATNPDHPQKADILLRSGIALFNLGRRSEAASVLERLVKADLPDCRCAEARVWLGKSYGRIGLREQAVESYQQVARLYPGSEWADDALYLAGNVHRDAGDMQHAVTFYRRLVTGYPESPFADSAIWWEGWAAYQTGAYRKAEQTFRELVNRYPRSFLVNQALYWQGRSAEMRGEGSLAVQFYRRVLTRGPYTYYGYRASERIAITAPLVPTEAEGATTPFPALDDGVTAEDPVRDGSDVDGPPDWNEEAMAALASNPVYHRTRELVYVGMKKEAAAELWSLQEGIPGRKGALLGLSKIFFELGDYYSSLIIVLRNFERVLERPSSLLPEDLWLLAYPQGYWTAIVTNARKYGIDPFFVAAIIREESQFRPDALSPAGARGVMQVMPETGEWIARNAGIAGFERASLFEADVNISVGTWYVSHLMKRFRGNLTLVSAAYNAGPQAAASWTGREHATADPSTYVESIPYAETRGYVKKVLRNYAEYRRLYGGTVEAAGIPVPQRDAIPQDIRGPHLCSSTEHCP